jgi:sugar/nucleoside kinase (ribokinase family)
MGYLAVSGHTNIDYLAHVERLPRAHESMEFTGLVRALGGTAANIAIASARLGVPTALMSRVGPDFPEDFAEELARAGVDTRGLLRVPGETTPVCWIFTDPQERQMAFIHQGAEGEADRIPPPRRAMAGARVLHIATGRAGHHLKAAAVARRLGLEVHFGPGQELGYVWTPASFRRMLPRCDALFVNEHELKLAMRYTGSRRPRDLLGHVQFVVGTAGARGAFALTPDGREFAPSIKARRVVNATGAGDAFRGGFYAARFRSEPLRECLRWGAAAASLCVERAAGAASGITPAAVRRRLSTPGR